MADISTSLPDTDLPPGATVTVDVGAAGATITSVVLHGYQEDVGDGTVTSVEPLWIPLPLSGQS